MHDPALQVDSPAPPRNATGALVPAVTRAMALLDLLAQQREALNPTQLASRLQLPKSSVHGLCNTLASRGYLRRHDDGSYFIGPSVMGLANAFVSRTGAAQEFATLWHELGTPPDETVILSVLAGTDVVYIAARNGLRPLGLAFTVGMRLPAHLAASGKAMLAFHDEATLRKLYGQLKLQRRHGAGGTMTLKALLDELAEVRRRGWSVDDESVREGVYCVGAPVFDASGEAVAGIGVCTHKATLDARAEQRHRGVVIDIARRLTQRLGGVPSTRTETR
jgi:DNA-binding IclR family transcriptional regulator